MNEPQNLRLALPEATVRCELGDADTPRRLVAGQAVPWNATARVASGQLVRFLPGSVQLSGRPVVRDHDPTRPVGIVSAADDDDTGHQVAVTVSTTPAGDETLTLAADGVLGFSVGVAATEYEYDTAGDEPVMVVTATQSRELSLLIAPAFGDESAVTSVAAAKPTEETNMEPTPTAPADTIPADAAGAATGPAELAATAPTGATAVREAPRQLSAGEFITEMVLAQRGDVQAQQIVQAALSAETTTTNPGVVPDQYVAGIIGDLNVYRPVWSSIQHAQLPAAGNNLIRPKWDSLPQVAKYTTENTEPPSNPVQIVNTTTAKTSWAHAIQASIALVNRSDPDYAQAYFREAVQSFYAALEGDTTDVLEAAAPAPLYGDTAKGAIAQAVVQSVTGQTTVGGVFAGTWPTWALVGMDVWGELAAASTNLGLAFGTGAIEMAAPDGSLSGLRVMGCPQLPGPNILVGAPAVATIYEQAVMDMRALVVNTMSWELGVYTDTALHVARPEILGHAIVGTDPGGASRAKKV